MRSPPHGRGAWARRLAFAALVACAGAEAPGLRAQEREAPRSLGALPGELGDVRWPAPPRIARTVAVEGDGEVREAMRSGTRLVVRGAVDRIVVDENDVEIRASQGAIIGGLRIERGVQRVALRGGRYGSIELAVPAQHYPPPVRWRRDWLASDVTIEGVHVEAGDSGLAVRGRRVAILDSRVNARRYALWCGDTEGFFTEDLVVAGNHFAADGPESTVRLVDVRRAFVVGNVLVNTVKHDFRVHGDSDAVLFARNRLVNTGIMVGSMEGDRIGSVWLLDNSLFHRTPSLFEVEPSRVRRLVARGNRIYTNRRRCFVCTEARDGWDVANNRIAPYRRPPAREGPP